MTQVQIKRLHSLTGHRDAVYALQGSAENSHFFSASGDGMVVRWNLQDPEAGELIARLTNSVYALHYLPKDDTLIAGHNYEGVHVLDWKNKKELGSLKLTTAAVFDIQSLGDRILVAAGDGSVSLVDWKSLTVLKRAQPSAKSARTIAVDSSQGEIAVGFSDNYIRVFDDKLALKHEWLAHEKSVFTLKYSPGGGMLLSGSRDARLKAWDVRARYEKAEEVVAHMYAINDIEFSPDGKHFVTCSMDKSIKVWDAGALRLLKVIDKARHAGHGTSVNKLLWTNFDNQLLSASDDRSISVWQIIF
ncbi:MAG TPA: WD40 repeat domain-containing protein [Chryseosolibacter sp.]|nr:WD40 repeat domain-containing protein [Chryseosolibacter sp.]